MTCPVCSSSRLVEIGVKLGDANVTMHSCSKCESRWWDENGQIVDLSDVIELATVRR